MIVDLKAEIIMVHSVLHAAVLLFCISLQFPLRGHAQRTVETRGQRDEGCAVPAYSRPLHEVNVTAETEALLLAEGRCYLACLRDNTHYQVRFAKQ